MTTSNTARTRAMHAENPRCYWCCRPTVLDAFKKRDPVSMGGTPAYNCATYDHLSTRPHIVAAQAPRMPRQQPDAGGVLACYNCNVKRGNMDVATWRLRIADSYYHGKKHVRKARKRGLGISHPVTAMRWMVGRRVATRRECLEWLLSLSDAAYAPGSKPTGWITKELAKEIDAEAPTLASA